MGKDISETDVFSFNEEFHNKLYKIKIATVSAQKESEPEKLETRHKVRQPEKSLCKPVRLLRLQVLMLVFAALLASAAMVIRACLRRLRRTASLRSKLLLCVS